jgi:hypothetical protein
MNANLVATIEVAFYLSKVYAKTTFGVHFSGLLIVAYWSYHQSDFLRMPFQFCYLLISRAQTNAYIDMRLSSYVVGETWKCYTEKRCVINWLDPFHFVFDFHVSRTIYLSIFWVNLKSRPHLSGTLNCFSYPTSMHIPVLHKLCFILAYVSGVLRTITLSSWLCFA